MAKETSFVVVDFLVYGTQCVYRAAFREDVVERGFLNICLVAVDILECLGAVETEAVGLVAKYRT